MGPRLFAVTPQFGPIKTREGALEPYGIFFGASGGILRWVAFDVKR